MNKFFDNEITCAAAVFLLGIDAFAILCAGFYSTFKVPMFAYRKQYEKGQHKHTGELGGNTCAHIHIAVSKHRYFKG